MASCCTCCWPTMRSRSSPTAALAGRVSDDQWTAVCHAVEAGIAGGGLEAAVIDGIGRISALLATHFPGNGAGRDELPDRPVLL